MKRLVKTPYARNLWRIMEKFNVLPTNPDFQKLTDPQIAFLFENIILDAKEKTLARKGIKPESYFEDEDDTWWEAAHDEFEALNEGDDEAEIARQVEAMSKKNELAEIKKRFATTEEWNKYLEESGNAASKLETENYIQEQLSKAYKEAATRSQAGAKWDDGGIKQAEAEANAKLQPLGLDSVQDAVALFNGFEDPEATLDDEDDFCY